MTPEIGTARRFLRARTGEILAPVEGLDEAQLHRAPDLLCAIGHIHLTVALLRDGA